MIRQFASTLRTSPLAARTFRNLKWIFLSQGAIAVLGTITLALSAQALGAAGLGVIALVEAYARIVARLIHLEAWQAAIRHGSEALEKEDGSRFGYLVGLSVQIDLAGGVLSALVALALAPVLAPTFGLEGEQGHLLSFAALAVLISLRSTGVALLRLYDRFDLLAKIDSATALLRLVLTALVFAFGGGLAAFVVVFIAFSIADGLAAYHYGLREMRQYGHRPKFGPLRDAIAANPGFLRLMWNSNLSVMLRESTQRLDTLILAALLPPTVIGYYHIARRVGEAANRLGRPLKQVLYPELTRLVARNEWDRVSRLVFGTTTAAAVVLAILLLPILSQIEAIITLVFGADFAPAAPVVAIQAVAVAVALAGVILGPALLSLEQDRSLVWAGAATAALFFVTLVPAVRVMGVSGAAAMRLISNLVYLLLCVLVVRQTLRVTGGMASFPVQGGAR
jgi:O-antigen/teichoic acid export membrane protein